VIDGEERSRAEPGSKWSCRQSDERHVTVDGWRRSYDRVMAFVHVKDIFPAHNELERWKVGGDDKIFAKFSRSTTQITSSW